MLDWNEVSWENGDPGQNFMSSQGTRTLLYWSTFCSYQIAWKLRVTWPYRDTKALKPIDPGGHTHLQDLSLTVCKAIFQQGPGSCSQEGASFLLLMECSGYPIIPSLAQVKDRGSQSRQVRQWKTRNRVTALWWVGCGESGGGEGLQGSRWIHSFVPSILLWSPAPGFCLAPLLTFLCTRESRGWSRLRLSGSQCRLPASTGFVTLGKFLNHSVLQFLHLLNRDSHKIPTWQGGCSNYMKMS